MIDLQSLQIVRANRMSECYPSPKQPCPYPIFALFLLFSVGSLDDVVVVIVVVAVAVAVAVAVVVVVVVPISTLTSATIPLSMGVFKVSP